MNIIIDVCSNARSKLLAELKDQLREALGPVLGDADLSITFQRRGIRGYWLTVEASDPPEQIKQVRAITVEAIEKFTAARDLGWSEEQERPRGCRYSVPLIETAKYYDEDPPPPSIDDYLNAEKAQNPTVHWPEPVRFD